MSDSRGQHSPRANAVAHSGTRTGSSLPQTRRFDESWVEVSSQPSSSSLSSIGDEIVTTGLHVGNPAQQQQQQQHRHRRFTVPARSLLHQQTAFRAVSRSSHGDYDESESEEDRLLTSSTENLSHPSEEAVDQSESEDDSDDGDNATALGRLTSPSAFRPQPNAFSHPPAHLAQRSYSTNSSVPQQHPHSGFTRPSFSQRSQTTRVHHRGGPSFMSPSVREDHDAALRASLTTLLSCAAAARGLPKSKEEAEMQRARNAGVGSSTQPVELRIVPESEINEEAPRVPPQPLSRMADERGASPSTRSPSRANSSVGKPKRASSAGRQARTSNKKKRTAMAVGQDEHFISPTLFTWVVSAGVVMLVSVVGFGAGYVIGREVGRQEGMATSMGSSVNNTASCGREVMRSSSGTLKRFKWSAVGKTIAASG